MTLIQLAPVAPMAWLAMFGELVLMRITDALTLYEDLQPGAVLTETHMDVLLTVTGWPEAAHDEAAYVAWCETGRWTDDDGNRLYPTDVVGDGGSAVGLWQVHVWPWQTRITDHARPGYMLDPLNAAEIALTVYEYDAASGKPWWQWIHDGQQQPKAAHCGPR